VNGTADARMFVLVKPSLHSLIDQQARAWQAAGKRGSESAAVSYPEGLQNAAWRQVTGRHYRAPGRISENVVAEPGK
jgi:hypothetical protein